MRYTILIHRGEDFGFWAECPAIPGCISQGKTLGELRKNIRDAIKSCLYVMNEEARKKGQKDSSKIIQIAI